MRAKPTLAQRQKYYRTWASKPGNRENKSKANKESYYYKKSLGICVRSGCANDAEPGLALCKRHIKDATRRKQKARADIAA